MLHRWRDDDGLRRELEENVLPDFGFGKNLGNVPRLPGCSAMDTLSPTAHGARNSSREAAPNKDNAGRTPGKRDPALATYHGDASVLPSTIPGAQWKDNIKNNYLCIVARSAGFDGERMSASYTPSPTGT